MGRSLGNYFFEKLVFPKVYLIDSPGIIITKYSKHYGKDKMQRSVFHFEDILAGVQIKTIKKFGKDKSNSLWYTIGKNTAFQYFSMSKTKKVPSILLPSILEYIFTVFRSVGATMAEKISFDKSNDSLVLFGSNNAFCRKSGEANLFAGAVSGFYSLLLGENIEAVPQCSDCPNGCKIVAKKSICRTLSSSEEDFLISGRNNKFNFPKIEDKSGVSFSDFVRFKKITMDDSGKFYFKDKVLVPASVFSFRFKISFSSSTFGYFSLRRSPVETANKVEIIITNKNVFCFILNKFKANFKIYSVGIVFFSPKNVEVLSALYSKYKININ